MKNNNDPNKNSESVEEISKLVTRIIGSNDDNNFYQFRVCLIGDSFVGKTSLMKRFSDNIYNDDFSATIGCDFKIISLSINSKTIKLQIWDTAGQERFKSISLNYLKSAQGFVFVFDISNKESFSNIEKWIQTSQTVNKNNLYNILVGNKKDCDETNSRQVSKEEAIELASKFKMCYLETSAKENYNVEEIFHFLTYKMNESYENQRDLINNNVEKSDFIRGSELEIMNIKEHKKCKC